MSHLLQVGCQPMLSVKKTAKVKKKNSNSEEFPKTPEASDNFDDNSKSSDGSGTGSKRKKSEETKLRSKLKYRDTVQIPRLEKKLSEVTHTCKEIKKERDNMKKDRDKLERLGKEKDKELEKLKTETEKLKEVQQRAERN